MPFFDDAGFWKRAQIAPNDLALAGVTDFRDLDRLTIFADNLVPTSCGWTAFCATTPPSPRASTLESSSRRRSRGARDPGLRGPCLRAALGAHGRARAVLDTWLWNRGQAPEYKAVPRHRTRTVSTAAAAAGRVGPASRASAA